MRPPLLRLKRSDLHQRGRERRWGLVGGCTSQAWKQPIRLWYDKCTLFEPFLKLQYIEQIQISNAHQQRTYPPICKLFFTKKNLVTAQWKISVVNMILLFTILWSPFLYISRVFQEKRKNTWFSSSTPPLPILYLFAIFKAQPPMPGAWLQDQSSSYLIFVIFFTRAKFLENKIYTEIYTVNCKFTQ